MKRDKCLLVLFVLSLAFISLSLEAAPKGKKGRKGGHTRQGGQVKGPLQAGRQESESGIRHSFLVCGKVTALFDEDSKVIWQTKERSRDGYVLSSGNILYSNGKVAKEVTRDGKLVWSYKLSSENSGKKCEMGTAQRLPDGNTLVVERGPAPQLVEVDPKGQVIHKVSMKPETDNYHMQTRMARKLVSGNYLVPHLLAFKIKEYDLAGKIVREIKTDLPELGGRQARNWPFTAILLDSGNVLATLTNGNKVVEFDADGKVAWRVDSKDVGGIILDPCGGQRLPNGNTMIASYAQRDPKGVKVLEVNPEGKVVWTFYHPAVKAHGIHVVSTNGKLLEGPALK